MLARFKSFIKAYTTFVTRKNGAKVYVHFQPIEYITTTGDYIFTTGDEEIVELLKKHPRYNDAFVLVEDIVHDVPEINDAGEGMQIISYEEMCVNPENIIRDNTVKNKNMAVAYIQSNFNTVFSPEAKSVHEMKKEAAERFNVVFTAWQ